MKPEVEGPEQPHEKRKVPIEKLMAAPTPELRTAMACEKLVELMGALLAHYRAKTVEPEPYNNKGKKR